MEPKKPDRRDFIKHSTALALAGWTFSATDQVYTRNPTQDNDLFIIGPKSGFSPQVGTLVSMMNWTRKITTSTVAELSMKDLDFLIDPTANTIGALLRHTIAQEKECQIQTFAWDRAEVINETDLVAGSLGNDARQHIQGNEIEFYLEKLRSVRETSIGELKNRDDAWLMEIGHHHPWGIPVNNYCQWFHVLEHECQHVGQIALIKNRLLAPRNDWIHSLG
ncbi:MAG: DinB family protein [Bacteroidota bacterium]